MSPVNYRLIERLCVTTILNTSEDAYELYNIMGGRWKHSGMRIGRAWVRYPLPYEVDSAFHSLGAMVK